jgi:hypothetical protein
MLKESEMKSINGGSKKKTAMAGLLGVLSLLVATNAGAQGSASTARTYPIVHTGVVQAYDNAKTIALPKEGELYFGQDANVLKNVPYYRDNGDGTVSDLVTGLMWQQDMGAKMISIEAQAKLATLNKGAYKDWRIPTMKELFSLSLFTGRVFGEKVVKSFIDTGYFKQPKGDTSLGEREIDAQTWSATDYTGLTMNNEASRFGMNFVDGRIKSYPITNKRSGSATKMYYRFVRGNSEYGKNRFHDNGDGTVSDEATGLMWEQADSGKKLDWKGALSYAADLNLGGKSDWRVPSIKELQSIVDYSRSLKATNSAAIDPLFTCSAITNPDGTKNYPYFWSATTLLDGPQPGNQAAYVCFGIATAKMGDRIIDAHGAGAVRSDPKSDGAGEYPRYFGPQGDMQVVFNHVRSVRTMP